MKKKKEESFLLSGLFRGRREVSGWLVFGEVVLLSIRPGGEHPHRCCGASFVLKEGRPKKPSMDDLHLYPFA